MSRRDEGVKFSDLYFAPPHLSYVGAHVSDAVIGSRNYRRRRAIFMAGFRSVDHTTATTLARRTVNA